MLNQLQKRRFDVKVDARKDWIKKETTMDEALFCFLFPPMGQLSAPLPSPFSPPFPLSSFSLSSLSSSFLPMGFSAHGFGS